MTPPLRFWTASILTLTLMFPTQTCGEVASPSHKIRSLNLLPWASHIAEASQRFGIPRDWIEDVIMLESASRTHLNGRPIRSHAGALGLMQVMPKTYAQMQKAHGLGSDPHQPRDNILAGTAYLRAMYDRYGYPGLFAAYNAGPGRYEASLRGVKLPLETRTYLANLTRDPPVVRSGSAIFVSLSSDQSGPGMPSKSALFVPLTGTKPDEN